MPASYNVAVVTPYVYSFVFNAEGQARNLSESLRRFGGSLNVATLLSVQGEPTVTVPGLEGLLAAIVIIGLLIQGVIDACEET